MNSRALPCLLVTVLMFVTAGLATPSANAAQNIGWSDTTNRENVLVQDCRGASVVSSYSPTLAYGFDFQITTSYSIDRDFNVFADYAGIDHPVMERRHVAFAGIAENAKTGLSLAYDGHFTRTATAAQKDVTITGLTLHLVTSSEEDLTVVVERDRSVMIDTPEAVLLAFAPRALDTSLCSYFAGLKVG